MNIQAIVLIDTGHSPRRAANDRALVATIGLDVAARLAATLDRSCAQKHLIAIGNVPCRCVVRREEARKEARLDRAVKAGLYIGRLGEGYTPGSVPRQRRATVSLERLTAPGLAMAARLEKDRSRPPAGDPRCASCQGSGVVQRAFNPDAKYESWALDGYAHPRGLDLLTAPQADALIAYGAGALPCYKRLIYALWPVCLSLDYLSEVEISAEAIVTPDGEWHTLGLEREGRGLRARRILSGYGDCWAVNVEFKGCTWQP